MPVYLGVNPVEYHGPHLSLHNDRLLTEGVVAELGARLQGRHDWPIVWADHLEVGVDPCPGPGSRPCRYADVERLVLESCCALASLGAQRVVLATFHGAPLHNLAIEAGVAWLRAQGIAALAPFHVVLQRMLASPDADDYADAFAPVRDEEARRRVAQGLWSDVHAGFFETSLALHWAPASVDEGYWRLPPCPEVVPDAGLVRMARWAGRLGRVELERDLRFAAEAVGWQALRPFPGYTSWPAPACAASGAAFAEHVLAAYDEVMDAVLLEGAEPPRPIMPWLRTVSARGRWPSTPRLGIDDVLANADAERG